MIQSIKNTQLSGLRVFIRADLDLPLGKKKGVPENRIADAIPTIRHALEQKAKVVVITHQGSLKDKWDAERRSLEPTVSRIVQLLDADAILADDCTGDAVKKLVGDLNPGRLLFLENLAMNPDEGACGEGLPRFLAPLCDVFVNDAFSQANRRLASTVLLPQLVPVRCAGIHFMEEVAKADASRLNGLPAYSALNK